ncbi:putative RNA polymerase-associated protein Rtf1 [Lupinus albus]|uniref:Putative RNA polymerase-associated protein Rtf1 n=1 Tax=Lupinus albus TaxID=3870 RepID=A0A6A4NNC7_LUPAL|nr:putative RNA polymerase-associated protein Rtf1 [Lupinus albus]
MKPFFQELIVGCFVRVGIGRSKSGTMHRLCMVKNVDVLENKTTHKYLNLVWGNETFIARWQMAMVSDSAPREEELKQWVKEVDGSGCRMPIKKDVLEKNKLYKRSTLMFTQQLL